MSNLSDTDFRFIARLVEHPRGPGYVLDFSDATFSEFFSREIGVNIDEERWAHHGTSKGKRLRYFLRVVDDKVALRTLSKLWEYRKQMLLDREEEDPVLQAKDRMLEVAKKVGFRPRPPATEPATSSPGTHKALTSADALGLQQELLALSKLDPQRRGFGFERFLHDLLDRAGLDPKASFRNTGEQIDGSFSLRGEFYLLEAKWTGPPVSISDLHTFHGKVCSKAVWARGLFISYSGYSDDAFKAFGSGKRIVCMDGNDLYETLDKNIPLGRVLDLKVRRAVETGRPFVPLREIEVL
ncbi:MAG: restriction endonuclease [Devosia sp.]